jgi:hypothetical protein
MGKSEASFWSIDKIVCSQWNEQNHTADVYISNYQGDSIDFQVIRTPDGDIVPFNITSDFRSTDWYEFTSENDAVDSIILEVDKELNLWASEVQRIRELLNPKYWRVGRGRPIDESIWASLAYLYDLRSSMYETKIIEQLAKDLKCDVPTAKERVKNLRRIGFLSAPGQGARGEGKATSKALKVLKKEGILDA